MQSYVVKHIFTFSILLCISSHVYASPLSWLNTYRYEEVIYKECTPKAHVPCTISIDQTLVGSVSVIGHNQNSITITATKKAKKEPEMRALALLVEQDSNKFTITTGYTKGKKKPSCACALDIVVDVPSTASVTIDSIGDVEAEGIKTVSITTEQGTIDAHNIDKSLTAFIDNKGTINLDNIHGTIDAINMSGDIIINNSYNDIVAHAENGKVKASCAAAPSHSTIELKTAAGGSIELYIPSDTQATIIGSTKRGKIESTVPITISPFTTKLTRKTYKEMPKNVSGIIGESGNAEIKLSSARGIRITPYEQTT